MRPRMGREYYLRRTYPPIDSSSKSRFYALHVVRLVLSLAFSWVLRLRKGAFVPKVTAVFSCLFPTGRYVGRALGRARSLDLTCRGFFLLLLVPCGMRAQAGVNSGASWAQYKSQCGIPQSTAYNDWVAGGSKFPAGSPCAPSTGSTGTTPTPSLPNLTQQQQLGMQLGMLGANMIGQGLHQLLVGTPPPPPDPAQQQAEIAAQQLNNSGVWFLRQKLYAQAINEFQKALANTPGDRSIQNNLVLAQRLLEQSRKDGLAATKTSSTLGQLLGSTPAGAAVPATNSPQSALNSIDLNSSASLMSSRGAMTPSNDSEALKSQIDGVLGSGAPLLANTAPVTSPQAKDIEQIFQSPPSSSAVAPVVQNQEQDARETSNAIDQALGQRQSADTQVAQQPAAQASSGSNAAPGSANFANQNLVNAIANPDFDGRTTGNAALTKFSSASQPGSDAVDLRGADGSKVDPARVSGTPASLGYPPASAPPQPAMRVAGVVTPSAPGAPIFDCQGDRALITRLNAGLPAQDEAIKRTVLALSAANSDSAVAREKALMAGFKTLNAAATTVSQLSETALAKVEGLKSHGMTVDAAARFRLMEQIKSLAEDGQTLADATEFKEKVITYYETGEGIGEILRVRQAAQHTLDKMAAIEKLLHNSGVQDDALEEIASQMALYGLGPIGGPIGDALVHTIANGSEFVTKTAQNWNSTAEAAAAERNLMVIRDQQRLVRERIYDLQQELAQFCANTKIANK